jgi:hypothetical protein
MIRFTLAFASSVLALAVCAQTKYLPPEGPGKPGYASAVEVRGGTVHVTCIGWNGTCVVYHTPPSPNGPFTATIKDGKGAGQDTRISFTGVATTPFRENGQEGVRLEFNEARVL